MSATYGACTAFAEDHVTPSGGNHTIAAGDVIVYVMVGAYINAANFMTGEACTYGGTAMDLILDYHNTTNYAQLMVYRLINPASGAQAVSFSWTGGTANEVSVIALSLSGADTSGTPERTVFSGEANNAAGTATHTNTVTDEVIGDLICDFECNIGNGTTYTDPSGSTLRGNLALVFGQNRVCTEAVTADGDQAQAFAVTNGNNARLQHITFCVKGGGGGQAIFWTTE